MESTYRQLRSRMPISYIDENTDIVNVFKEFGVDFSEDEDFPSDEDEIDALYAADEEFFNEDNGPSTNTIFTNNLTLEENGDAVNSLKSHGHSMKLKIDYIIQECPSINENNFLILNIVVMTLIYLIYLISWYLITFGMKSLLKQIATCIITSMKHYFT